LLLQPRHSVAHRRLAAVQVSGSLGKTTLLHHRLKHRPVFQIDPRHRNLSTFLIKISQNLRFFIRNFNLKFGSNLLFD
jgi:hypothetical protein